MKWLAVVVALAPGLCWAEAPWYLGGGLGRAEREYGVAPFGALELEFVDGAVYHVEGGMRPKPDLLLRGTYAYTNYEEFTALGTLLIAENVAQRELRLGAFYAPRPTPAVGFRLGGGYATFGDILAGTSQGGFAEAAMVLHAGAQVSFDLSAARTHLDGDEDRDGTDLRLAATIDVPSAVYVTLSGRRLEFASADEIVDIRFTVGRSFGAAR